MKASGSVVQIQRPLLVRERPEVQAVPQAPRGPVLPGHGQPDARRPGRITAHRLLPTGEPGQRDEPMVKSPDVIARMRVAGRAGRRGAGRHAAPPSAPGVTTDELDVISHQAYIERGAYPTTLNYHGFPKSVCTSVNEVICHGIPDDRPLRRRRHRQHRRHRLPRRRARRLQRHLLRRRGRSESPPRWSRSPASAWTWASRRCGRAGRICDIGRAIETHATPTATAWCGRSSATASASSSTRRRRSRTTTTAPASHHHGAGHDLHHRADDHHGRRGGSRCGTTAGPRSPPTASAPPSSSTPSLVTDDGAESSPWSRDLA